VPGVSEIMQEFKYNGEKAILITSEDIQAVYKGMSDYTPSTYWAKKIDALKQEGFKYICVVTSLPRMSIPTILRTYLRETKNCYFGVLDEIGISHKAEKGQR